MGDTDLKIALIAVTACVLFAAAINFACGYSMGRHATRTEAVEAGVAEWVVVGSDGKTEFRWKEVDWRGE